MTDSGWVFLDKASGLFSRTAGARVARLFGARTVGHIGTLDPMATGVLPIAIGSATKMIPFIEDVNPAVKEYLFSMVFGFETDTLDITGRIVRQDGFVPELGAVLAVLPGFVGKISQIPPAFSAVHVSGRRAYELARSGQNVTPAARSVEIYALEFIGQTDQEFQFRLRCSRGTYVRALARDIAAAVGAIATVTMIRRTQSGAFTLKNTVKLDFLENLVNNGGDFRKYLNPVDFGLGDIPVLNLGDESAARYRNGGFIQTGGDDGLRRVYSGDVFIGIGTVVNGELRPKRTI